MFNHYYTHIGRIFTVNVFLGKKNDIDAVKRCNSENVTLGDLKYFNHRLLQTTIYKNERNRYPTHSGPWVIFGPKDKDIPQIVEFIRYGISRKTDMKALNLPYGWGSANIVSFIPVIADIGNGKPSLEFAQDGKSQLIVANEPSKIIVVQNMPRNGGQLSAKDYQKLVGVAPTYNTELNFHLRDDSGNFLLRRGDYYIFGVYVRHDVAGDGWDDDLLGVQGEQKSGAQAEKQ